MVDHSGLSSWREKTRRELRNRRPTQTVFSSAPCVPFVQALPRRSLVHAGNGGNNRFQFRRVRVPDF